MGIQYSPEQAAVIGRVLARPGSPEAAKIAVVTGPPGSGKAQPLDSLVLTPAGQVEIGKLAVGDTITDPQTGGVQQVTGVFPQGRKQVFRVYFEDGHYARACAEHLWIVNTIDRMRAGQVALVWSTEKCHEWREARNTLALRIPITAPVVLAKRELHPGAAGWRMSPWLMGVLFARVVKSGRALFVTEIPEAILKGVREQLPGGTVIKRTFSSDRVWRIAAISGVGAPVIAEVKRLGFWDKAHTDRLLPDEYVMAEQPEDRFALLRGLMDARGHSGPSEGQMNVTRIRCKSEKLAEQVAFLVQSVGGTASMRVEDSDTGRKCWRVSMITPENPFKVRADEWCIPHNLPERILTRIEPDGEAECVCISVNGQAQAYLTNGLIVTHNTTLSKAIMGGFSRLFGPGSAMALSPTGKAARRFTEVTGHPCATIHRALAPWEKDAEKTDEGDTSYAFRSPLDIVPRGALRAILVDESSMVDMRLFLRLMKNIPPWLERIVFVGDADQLPSVGAGCVFRDLMTSGHVPTFKLTHVYRQDEHSWIRHNTININNGQRPVVDPEATDYFEHLYETVPECVDRVVALAKEHPEAQVLTPTNRGVLGATNLNQVVREAINPRGERRGWQAGELTFFRNDRVIQIKNNYELDVMNGETGVAVGIVLDGDHEKMAVDFGGRKVLYDQEQAEQLRLAFALTIHKAQGSESPGIITVIHSSHTFLLNRQLFYVALSRARERAWVVGDDTGIKRAVKMSQTSQRKTRLAERIREAFAGERERRVLLREQQGGSQGGGSNGSMTGGG